MKTQSRATYLDGYRQDAGDDPVSTVLKLFAIAVLTAACAAALAAPAEAPSRVFEGRDLFGLQYATDPQIRPDGGAVVYVRRSFDIMTDRMRQSLWLVDAESEAQKPLATAPDSHSPRWSPSGDRLAYVTTDEGGRQQLHVRWMRTGQTAKLADLVSPAGIPEWSPDGQWIAFTMFAPEEKPKLGEPAEKPEGAQWAPPSELITELTYRADGKGYLKAGYTHIYVVPADGGAARQLTFGAYNDAGSLSWTPDSRHLVFTGNRTENWRRQPINTEVYQLSVADGSVTPLTARDGPDQAATVSPDGRSIAYLGHDDERLGHHNMRLYLMDRDGRNRRMVSGSLDRSIDRARWSADGRSLLVQYGDRGTTRIARISLDGRLQPLAEGLSGSGLERPYTGGEFSVAANGTIAFTSGSAQRPSDVSIVRGGQVGRLTSLSESLLADKVLADVKPLKVTSSFDQRAIDAWVVTPPGFDRKKKYPLILEIHGGPFAAYGPTFSTDCQLYAAAGYVVVYVNPRGSTTYGGEFANLIHHRYPGEDYDDLISAVDAAIAEGYVDSGNLFVTGGSGGGVLTTWIVGKTSRFRAAAAEKPVIHWTSAVLTMDNYPYIARFIFSKLPWEDPETYWQRSPLSLVGSVTTPTLVVVGDRDLRAPVSESEQYYQALQLRGVPTALLKLPGVAHQGLTNRPSQSAAKVSAILAWFQRYRAASLIEPPSEHDAE